MPREKVKLEKIKNRQALGMTFSKQRKRLFKKAKELSIMCDAQVGVIVFSAASKLKRFGNPGIDEIIEKRNTHPDKIQASLDSNVEEEIERLRKKCDEQELIINQMEGKELGNLSMEQLNLLEEKMQNDLNRVIAKQREKYAEIVAELQQIIHLMEDEEKGQEKASPGSIRSTPNANSDKPSMVHYV